MTEALGSAEEHARLSRRVKFANRSEYHVPVRPAEASWRTQARDGVLFGVRIVDHDVGGIVGLDLCCQVL